LLAVRALHAPAFFMRANDDELRPGGRTLSGKELVAHFRTADL